VGRRLAFLIGNQQFLTESELSSLRGPRNDVTALARLLSDPERGHFDDVKSFFDQPHYEIMPVIEDGLQSARSGDLVLIFYSGHGKLDSRGTLFLATANTRQVALRSTAIPIWSLHEAIQASRCNQAVLVLDCCYSGAASSGLRGALDGQLRAVQRAAGFYILTSSTSIQTSAEGEEERDGKMMGRFTGAIVEGIESGNADRVLRGHILLSDLKDYVERTVRGQTPQYFVHQGSGDPLISWNPAAPERDHTVIRAPRSGRVREIIAHIQNIGDVRGTFGDWIGVPGSGLWMEGFQIVSGVEIAAEDVIYRAIMDSGPDQKIRRSDWMPSGHFCGSRGLRMPILGFCIELRNEAARRYECTYSATFIGGGLVSRVPAGKDCMTENNDRLEAFRIILSFRDHPEIQLA
jgi:hypothetical protein